MLPRLKQTPIYAAARRVYRAIRPRPESIFERNDRYNVEMGEVIQRVLTPDSTSIDVGAHVGEILRQMFAAAPNGRHHAFEPIPHLASALATDFPEARVHPFALSDDPGTSTFFYLPTVPSESGLRRHMSHTIDPVAEEITVDVRRLDDVIVADEPIALIKLDAEGAEIPILRGGVETIRRCRPLLVFEAGDGTTAYYGITPEDIWDFVSRDIGMRLSTMRRWLDGERPFNRERFLLAYRKDREFYFIAHD